MMLIDALAAERFRLIRDRAAVFWGFLFVPIAALVVSIVGAVVIRHMMHQRMPPGLRIDLGDQAINAIGGVGNPFVAPFLLIGAAAMLAGDYRWETWRLITPRNARHNLLGAKLIIFGEAVVWGLLLIAVSSGLSTLIGATIGGGKVVGPSDLGAFGARFVGVLAISWLQVMVMAALAACIGVLARSTMGPIVAGVVVAFCQPVLAAMLRGPDPEPGLKVLAIPSFAADLLRAYVTAAPGAAPHGKSAALALLLLLVWLAALSAGAIALFRRQDLTRE